MYRLKYLPCALLLGAALTLPVAAQETVATVNGQSLSKGLLEAYSTAMAAQGRDPGEKELLDELVVQEVLVQQAEKEGLDQSPEFHQSMEVRRRNLLAQALLENFMASIEPDEAAMKELYQQAAESAEGEEYKARHILVASESEANAVIEELQGGADFAELAKQRSTGPSGPNGGDLGWFAPDSMVPPFTEALKGMEKGRYSSKPVQTRFGWHVILFEDMKTTQPPTYEEVEDNLRQEVERRKLAEFVAELRDQAKVEIPTP